MKKHFHSFKRFFATLLIATLLCTNITSETFPNPFEINVCSYEDNVSDLGNPFKP